MTQEKVLNKFLILLISSLCLGCKQPSCYCIAHRPSVSPSFLPKQNSGKGNTTKTTGPIYFFFMMRYVWVDNAHLFHFFYYVSWNRENQAAAYCISNMAICMPLSLQILLLDCSLGICSLKKSNCTMPQLTTLCSYSMSVCVCLTDWLTVSLSVWLCLSSCLNDCLTVFVLRTDCLTGYLAVWRIVSVKLSDWLSDILTLSDSLTACLFDCLTVRLQIIFNTLSTNF